ncbi:MAG: cryptochrome/photolyase family protein [Flavobacteriales bacterium]
MEKYNASIFWFRRDLRLHDNHGLYQALKQSKSVIPIFIFDTNILSKLGTDDKRVSLLFDRLETLNQELAILGKQIHILYGEPIDEIKTIISKTPIDACFTNNDYEPYARQRDEAISTYLQQQNIDYCSFKDQVIFEKTEILTDAGKPYGVYTPYKKKWKSKFKVSMSYPFPSNDLLEKLHFNQTITTVSKISDIGFEYSDYHLTEPSLEVSSLIKYGTERDIPSVNGTTNISVHLRFGMMSVRELVKIAYQYSEPLLDELIWRSFFAQVLWNNPHVVHSPYREKYNTLKWNDSDLFRQWKYGNTGFPLVDAGMRQLYDTGYMHNRVRMIAASFLVKNLGIDWRLGEAYFASTLLDFDLASNNGNWQWVAGTGCDAAPYFRVFNPNTQLKRFDPDLIYCKQWIPELHDDGFYPVSKIVDLKTSAAQSIQRYKQCQ